MPVFGFSRSEVARLLRKLPGWLIRIELPQPRLPKRVCMVEQRPVDVAHWLPNMPRGSEDRRAAGAVLARCAAS